MRKIFKSSSLSSSAAAAATSTLSIETVGLLKCQSLHERSKSWVDQLHVMQMYLPVRLKQKEEWIICQLIK